LKYGRFQRAEQNVSFWRQEEKKEKWLSEWLRTGRPCRLQRINNRLFIFQVKLYLGSVG
jgi:hypothetical protein